MLYDPMEKETARKTEERSVTFRSKSKLYERWMAFKNHILLRKQDSEQ
jgi:hypothetical protein